MILVKSYIDVKTRGLIALQLVRIEQTKKCSQIVGPFLDRCNGIAVCAVSFLFSGICACLFNKVFGSHFSFDFVTPTDSDYSSTFPFLTCGIFSEISFKSSLIRGTQLKTTDCSSRGEFLGQELYVLQVCHLRHFQVTLS